jgi:hypothetical protein
MTWDRLLEPDVLAVVGIFIVPVIVGGVVVVTKMLIKHRERMAMIERGMNPDAPGEMQDVDPQGDRTH